MYFIIASYFVMIIGTCCLAHHTESHDSTILVVTNVEDKGTYTQVIEGIFFDISGVLLDGTELLPNADKAINYIEEKTCLTVL